MLIIFWFHCNMDIFYGLYLKDISDYGFMDGMRYAFLQTEKGLIYSKWAFTSLNALSLDDVKKYVLEKINQVK